MTTLLGIAAGAGLASAAEEGTAAVGEAARLEAAYAKFVEAVREAGEIVKQHPFYQ